MNVAKRNYPPRRIVPLQVQFGAAVRASRESLGITQEELGWRAGLHRTYITDIERGARNLTLKSVEALAKALEVPIASLLARASGEEVGVANVVAKAGLGEILMVEDSVVDAQLAVRAFKKAKFTNPVYTVKDGAQALDYLSREGAFAERSPNELPALVLLDLHLPKVSGLEVLRRIKEEPATRNVPVVVLTASRLHRDVEECLRLGAEAYLVKPVGFENFSKVTAGLNMTWALFKSEPGAQAGRRAVEQRAADKI
ncbi:response regulator [Nibricoccus aquaticus]|nr:response regulator [Nibricoccus aquaticus]